MDFKFEIDDESCDTETGRVVYFNNTVELLPIPSVVYDRVEVSVGHKRVFDGDGMEDAHVLSSVQVTLFHVNSDNKVKFNADRESFHQSFSQRGLLFQSIFGKRIMASEDNIADFVDDLRKFICSYCEQNDIVIFDK